MDYNLSKLEPGNKEKFTLSLQFDSKCWQVFQTL